MCLRSVTEKSILVELTAYDQGLLSGRFGKAKQTAMRVIKRAAQVSSAPHMIDITMAHVNSCFYSGQAGVEFAEFLVREGAELAVPTLTNTGLIDLLHPDLRSKPKDAKVVEGARKLMGLYEQMGCEVVWTCAPYQLKERPGLGDQIVGSESNAVSFYNSALGARTNKYGDFLDICAAITGRVPFAGLHTDAGRCGDILLDLSDVPDKLKQEDIFYHVLGIVMGQLSGVQTPVIKGLPSSTTEDQLKAISAAGAASGGVEMFHAIGVTPEAPDQETAFAGTAPQKITSVTADLLTKARDMLSHAHAGKLAAVCLGTPHFSVTEFEQLMPLIKGRYIHPHMNLFISTSRFIVEQIRRRGWVADFEAAGIRLVTDTCTYFTPIMNGVEGRVMTNSAKWAYYAPGMLDVEVVFGSLEECVNSALTGAVQRDAQLWDKDFWGAS